MRWFIYEQRRNRLRRRHLRVSIHPDMPTRSHPLSLEAPQPVEEGKAGALQLLRARRRPRRPSSPCNHRLVPVPNSTLFGWHPDSHAYVSKIERAVRSLAVVRLDFARRAMFHLHAAKIVQNKANRLLDGLSVGV